MSSSKELEVTHNEIYARLVAVETKVDAVQTNTAGMVAAFDAAQGAFTVLEFLATIAKPVLWLAALAATVGVLFQNLKVK